MSNFKFCLICTSRDLEVFERFWVSLIHQDYNYEIHLIFVNQTNSSFNFYSKPFNISVEQHIIDPCGLSSARNYALKHVIDCDIIAFPDDDCWYDNSLLSSIAKNFSVLNNIAGVCTNIFDPINNLQYGRRKVLKKNLNKFDLFHIPISVSLFLNYSIFRDIKFDLNFGVGSSYGSGEESLYILEGLSNINFSRKIFYNGLISVYHEVDLNPSENKVSKYSFGYGVFLRYSSRYLLVIPFLVFIYIFFRSLMGHFFKEIILNEKSFLLSRAKSLFKGYFYESSL